MPNNLSKAALWALTILIGFGPSRSYAQPIPPQIDALSWQSFAAVVRPSGVPGKVVYETWASDQDIYVAHPCPTAVKKPNCNVPTWPVAGAGLGRAKPFQASVLGRSHIALTRKAGGVVEVIGPAQGCGSPPGLGAGNAAANSGFPTSGCVGEEVRRDRASFNYIVSTGLWSRAGLTAFYNRKGMVGFPWNAVEVKGDWIPVATLAQWLNQPQSFVTSNFYIAKAQVSSGGPVAAYALTSLHLSIKAPGFPNWVWADFENAYTPGRCDQTGCTDRFGAQTPVVPANQTAWKQYGACPETAAAQQLLAGAGVAKVFSNYCLTGTQVAFTGPNGATLLGSPIIEPLNANVPLAVSSCISCHAGASFNAQGPNFNVGTPIGPHAPPAGYAGYDFLWGVLLTQK